MINDMKYTYEFLRKCHGLRFKAEISGEPAEGIVKVDNDKVYLCHGKELLGYPDVFHRAKVTLFFCEDVPQVGVSAFKIVPRDSETYKDWQVGDVFMCNDTKNIILFRCGEIVAYKERYGVYCSALYTCDELLNRGCRLVLTDIEKQILKEGEKEDWKPQDGDICYAQTKRTPQRFIFIEGHRQYMLVDLTNSGYGLDTDRDWEYSDIRLATDEEKRKLFDALAKEGKRWNAEEKRIEDIPKLHEFCEYDPVLVRDKDYQKWRLLAFERYEEGKKYPYICKNNTGWMQCIPYNKDTGKLLDTSNPYTLNR